MLLTIIVLDSVGLGALPDAAQFGDQEAHTLNHTLAAAPISLPNLAKLGLGHIEGVHTNPQTIAKLPLNKVQGAFGRMREVSLGKDTSTGHWELMGLHLEAPFRVFPHGFPTEVMAQFDAATGRGHLCNQPYSGTKVITDYGAEHLDTGAPIVYTSADSVFQIAAHSDVVPLETLYKWCQSARQILQGSYAVARVIARPFVGDPKTGFSRLGDKRKDFSLEPPTNVLDDIAATGQAVVGIGKIPDIYAGRGFSECIHTDNNSDGINKILQRLQKAKQEASSGLIFANLVDFDSKYGHRRNPQGYSKALAEFDSALPDILQAIDQLASGALLIVSDHGNDPTWAGTDHTREYALLLGYRSDIRATSLGERASFADVGATAAEALGANWAGAGQSFWAEFANPNAPTAPTATALATNTDSE